MDSARYHEPAAVRRGWMAVAALSVFLAAAMFYVFPSGQPQPADVLLVAVAAFLAWPAMRLNIANGNHAIVALVFWVIVVNSTWYIITGASDFITYNSFYVYNLLVFILFSYVYMQHGQLAARWLARSIAAALLIQVAVLSGGGDAFRAVGTFNNPNQLGYWSILLLATYGVLCHDRKLSLADVGVVALALWSCMLSLSRAAIVPGLVLGLVFLFLHPASKHVRATIGCGAAAVLLVFLLQGGMSHSVSQVETLQGFEKRYSRGMTRDESELEVRGYNRIWEFPEFNFFGAGEGQKWRFGGREMHSSLGTMLFSYGIVGAILFLFVLYQSLRSTPLLVKLYVLPIMIYGLTHQGLRFSHFWILLGIAAAISARHRAERRGRALGMRVAPTPYPNAS